MGRKRFWLGKKRFWTTAVGYLDQELGEVQVFQFGQFRYVPQIMKVVEVAVRQHRERLQQRTDDGQQYRIDLRHVSADNRTDNTRPSAEPGPRLRLLCGQPPDPSPVHSGTVANGHHRERYVGVVEKRRFHHRVYRAPVVRLPRLRDSVRGQQHGTGHGNRPKHSGHHSCRFRIENKTENVFIELQISRVNLYGETGSKR